MTRTAIGRLLFQHPVQDRDKPLHNMAIELFDLDLVDDDLLASGYTDLEGRFELSYDPRDAGRFDEPDLALKLYSEEWHYNKSGDVEATRHVIAVISVGEVTTDRFDFGDRRIAYWEYENPEDESKIAFTPRVEVIDGEVPQGQRLGRKLNQAAVMAEYLVPYTKHKLIHKFDNDAPSVENIVDNYPKNLTRTMDAEQVGASRSDDYLADLVLNGFNPCLFKQNDQGELYVEFKWNGYEQDGIHFAPNTTAYFRKEGDKLQLLRIDLQKRVGGNASAHASYRRLVSYSAADGEVWDRVKRLFRVNLFLFGEAITHLGGTHLNVEQYIVPIVRNLRKNPVGHLLAPHFYGTVSINLGANSLLIDDDGLVGSTSAATPASVAQIVRDSFAGFNWYGWQPRQPVCENHRFAQLGNLYWEVVSEYVDWFFTQYEHDIRAQWAEVYRLSQELIRHAVPYRDQQDSQWLDNREINGVDKPHPLIDGEVRSISPITESEQVDDVGWNNLKQVCRYLIFHTTFTHSWVNDSQYDMGGDIEFATLGVNVDLTNLDYDETKAVRTIDAIQHPFITRVLTETKYGYIMRNEDKDIHPQLQKILASKRDQFNQLEYKIKNIRSCINI